jgi:cytidylate kinase
MPVITISSTYGAGGTPIAEAVAERLGWQLVSRAIPAQVAERLAVPIERALARDDRLHTGLGRLLFARAAVFLAGAGAGTVGAERGDDDDFKVHTEEVIRSIADASSAVVVGRGGAHILAGRPDALHVRLDGPMEARVRQAMAELGISEAEARRALRETDRARRLYVRHFYGADWSNPTAYHLVLDSTAIPVEACTEVVLAAARGRLRV